MGRVPRNPERDLPDSSALLLTGMGLVRPDNRAFITSLRAGGTSEEFPPGLGELPDGPVAHCWNVQAPASGIGRRFAYVRRVYLWIFMPACLHVPGAGLLLGGNAGSEFGQTGIT